MIVKIEYETNTLIPEDLEEIIEDIKERIIRDRLEVDKIHCHISMLRSKLLIWIIKHKKI